MRVVHLLRKYNPAEWGGTETVLLDLLDGLQTHGVKSTVYCPTVDGPIAHDPYGAAGHAIKRFKAIVPVWGISEAQRRQLIGVAGNLLMPGALWALWREPGLSLVHTHTLGRIGAMGRTVARWRKVPLVVSVHGGVYDVSPTVDQLLVEPLKGGWEWGKAAGWLLGTRRTFQDADAILTLNPNEARLLRERYPHQRILCIPNAIPARAYRADQCEAAYRAFPALRGRRVLIILGRIDPVKNPLWVVEQAPQILRAWPDVRLVFAGAETDEVYAERMRRAIDAGRLGGQIVLTGGLPPRDPRLIGLLQLAEALVLPSLSETFGIVLLEAWAAGTVVVASRTSGALQLVKDGENGWLFDVEHPETFHAALAQALQDPGRAKAMARTGGALVEREFDNAVIASRIKDLYEELIAARAR